MALARFSFDCDGVSIRGEGVVEITGAPAADFDPRPGLLELLANLDPQQIEQAALNRQGWGDTSLAADILGVISDIVEGKPLT